MKVPADLPCVRPVEFEPLDGVNTAASEQRWLLSSVFRKGRMCQGGPQVADLPYGTLNPLWNAALDRLGEIEFLGYVQPLQDKVIEVSKPLRFPEPDKPLLCAEDVIAQKSVKIFVNEGIVKDNGASYEKIPNPFQVGCSPLLSDESNIIELDPHKIDDLADIPFQDPLPFGQPVHVQGPPSLTPMCRVYALGTSPLCSCGTRTSHRAHGRGGPAAGIRALRGPFLRIEAPL